MDKHELGAFLRSRRERLRPEDVGMRRAQASGGKLTEGDALEVAEAVSGRKTPVDAATVAESTDLSPGKVKQVPGRSGCLALRSVPGCTRARALRGVSSLALSPDGKFLYSTSFGSNAVDIFRRNK